MTNPSDDDDRALLNRFALAGDNEALGALASRHERSLLGLASGVLGGRRALAVEAVQSAWVKVIRYGRSFRGTSSVRTWLYRIVINQCRDLRRREATQSRRESESELGSATSAGAAGACPAPSSVDMEQRQRIGAAVAALPEAQREIVLLCYHGDLTHVQVADILNIPLGTLKSRLHTALSTLRETLAVERVS